MGTPLFTPEVIADAKSYLGMCASEVDNTSLILCVYGNGSQHKAFENLKKKLHPKDRIYFMCSPSRAKDLVNLVGTDSVIFHPSLPGVPIKALMLPKEELAEFKRKWDEKHQDALRNQWTRDTGFFQTQDHVCSLAPVNLWNLDNCFPSPIWADKHFRGGNLVTGTNAN